MNTARAIAEIVGWGAIGAVLLGVALHFAIRYMDDSGIPRTVEPEDEVERELTRLLADYGEPCPVIQLRPAQVYRFPGGGAA